MSLGEQAKAPPSRTIVLDLTQDTLVAAYRAYSKGLLTSLPASISAEEASALLQSLYIDSAAWLQEQGRKKASSPFKGTYRDTVDTTCGAPKPTWT